MKYFIQEWKFFNEQLLMAQAGDRNSMLCGLNQMFCDLVIKKAISILTAPDINAFNTPLEKLCGGNYAERYFAMVGIEEPFDTDAANAIYKIELACMPTDGLPAHYVLAVPKQDFDYFLARMMLYINPDMLALVDWYDKQAKQKDVK